MVVRRRGREAADEEGRQVVSERGGNIVSGGLGEREETAYLMQTLNPPPSLRPFVSNSVSLSLRPSVPPSLRPSIPPSLRPSVPVPPSLAAAPRPVEGGDANGGKLIRDVARPKLQGDRAFACDAF